MEGQKSRQIEYHEREHYCAQPRNVDNSNLFVAWLNGYRLRKMIEMIGTPLAGKTVLSVCGGDGEEADLLQGLGAIVTVADLSHAGVKAARVRNSTLQCLRVDAETLAFHDGSFDWAIVRDGLHHLARPVKGLYELERISREGFALLEGQDSILVRLLAKLGLAENWDPAGGYVYRFSRREVRKIFSSIQTLAEWQIFTCWLPFGSDVLRFFPFFRRFIYPLINRPAALRILGGKWGRIVLKAFYSGFNFLFGRWGNSLIVVARKKIPAGTYPAEKSSCSPAHQAVPSPVS
ncbi:MAG TPA: class I SAM-dependent methyltransferase [Acidobacteriota bacterium]|nr:class I SAM-dependent methyltransferase [Acidobacteriota bacterium]